VLKWTSFLIAVAVLCFLQGLLNRFVGAGPDFGPVLMVYLGLFVRRGAVVPAAALAGVLRAAIDAEPVGIVVLASMVLALCVEGVRGIVFRERLLTQWVVSVAAGAFYIVLRLLGAALVPSASLSGSALVDLAGATLVAALFAPLIFALLRLVRASP